MCVAKQLMLLLILCWVWLLQRLRCRAAYLEFGIWTHLFELAAFVTLHTCNAQLSSGSESPAKSMHGANLSTSWSADEGIGSGG